MELFTLIFQGVQSYWAQGLKRSIVEVHNRPSVCARALGIDNQWNLLHLRSFLEIVDPLQDTLFGLLPVISGASVHIQGSCVSSKDVDDREMLDFLLSHETDQRPTYTHVDKVGPAYMVRCNDGSSDFISIIELFLQIEAHLEDQSSCIDPEKIDDSLRVFEVPLERANKTVCGQKSEHGSCMQGKADETALDDLLLVPFAEILAN